MLVASLFFLLGRNGSELLAAQSELQRLKTVHVYYPVQNSDQLLKMLQDQNMNEEVVIQLPETDSFHVIGEPEVIYVKDSGDR